MCVKKKVLLLCLQVWLFLQGYAFPSFVCESNSLWYLCTQVIGPHTRACTHTRAHAHTQLQSSFDVQWKNLGRKSHTKSQLEETLCCSFSPTGTFWRLRSAALAGGLGLSPSCVFVSVWWWRAPGSTVSHLLDKSLICVTQQGIMGILGEKGGLKLNLGAW